MSGGAAGAGGSTVMAVCPTGTDAKINLANLIPAAGSVDFCVQAMGDTAIQGPLYKCMGGADTGLPYQTVSVGSPLASGTYTVNAVPNGDCTATPLATTMITIDGTAQHLVAAIGGANGVAASIATFTNDPNPTDGNLGLRFVDAIVSSPAIDLGLTDMAGPGAVVTTAVFTDISFGQISPANPSGTFAIDANGYADAPAVGMQTVGAAPTGTTPAFLSVTINLDSTLANVNFTAYGLGIFNDTNFPPTALLCLEDETKATPPNLTCAVAM
jgi:hypothetical protein